MSSSRNLCFLVKPHRLFQSNRVYCALVHHHRHQSNNTNTATTSKLSFFDQFDNWYKNVILQWNTASSGKKKKSVKLSVLDRIRKVVDNGQDFIEFSSLCGYKLPYGTVPRGGLLTGLGFIHSQPCIIVANDSSIKGGTIFPVGVDKQLRAQRIATANRLPIVQLVDSGGAFLPLQSNIFPDKWHGGRTFYNQAIMSSEDLAQIVVVCGSCTAGGAYIPTMAQEAAMVDKIGSVFLAGPPLVKAALGEEISAEELGGARLHCSVSGCTDYFCANEDVALAGVRERLKMVPCSPPMSRDDEPSKQKQQEALNHLMPTGPSWSLDNFRKILDILLDDFLEFKALYGHSAVCGFGTLASFRLGVVGVRPSLDQASANKVSHVSQLCRLRGIPLLLFTLPEGEGTQGQADWPVEEWSLLDAVIEIHASPVESLARQLGHHLDDNVRFSFSWPTAYIRPQKFGHDVTNMDETLDLAKLSSCIDDGLLLPANSRAVLLACLSVISQENALFPTYSQKE